MDWVSTMAEVTLKVIRKRKASVDICIFHEVRVVQRSVESVVEEGIHEF